MIEATVAWVAERSPGAELERAGAERALADWARVRGLHLSAPSDAKRPTLAIDWEASLRAEAQLERARDGIAALDADATDRALARAESELLLHPELPQAAWLLAEVYRGWTARWLRIAPIDPERAANAWARADALDGGRAAGVLEAHPSAALAAAHATLAFDPAAGLVAWLDGVAVASGKIERGAGRHQLVLTSDEPVGPVGPVFAAWVTIAEGTVIRVGTLAAAACSADELSRVRHRGDGIDAPGVRCASWVAAVADPASPGAVLVARCEESRCAPLAPWRVQSWSWGSGPPTSAGSSAGGFRWPTWATWTVVGVGAATLTGVILAASGAFQTARSETHFVSGGVKIQGFPLPF